MKFTNESETILENDGEYQAAYLDWKNNFLSVSGFAAHYGWSDETAKQVISDGRALHESEVAA